MATVFKPQTKRGKGSLYDELGIPDNASTDDVKKAFRDRSKQTHPDRGGSAQEFDRVRKAALVLLNPQKRQHYDQTGDSGEEQPQAASRHLQMLEQMLHMLVLDEGDDSRNLLVLMRQRLKECRENTKTQMAKLRAASKKVKRLQKRLAKVKAGTDELGLIFKRQEAGIAAGLVAGENELKAIRQAELVLERYLFVEESR